MIVDSDGVPTLIQDIEYLYSHMAFKTKFFNGLVSMFPTSGVCPSIGLMQNQPSRMQWLEAQNNIEKGALKHWEAINA